MTLTTFFIALTIGLVIIVALSVVIVRLLHRERIRKVQQSDAEARFLQGRAELVDGIRVLLQVVGTEELGWIEASIRIKVLLDRLSLDLSQHPDIGVFYTVYAETEHIPTHDQWNDLPKSAKLTFRLQMQDCEEKYLVNLRHAKQALANYPLV